MNNFESDIMDLDFDFALDDSLDFFADSVPFYDSIDLAHGIDAMGPLNHAMPSLEQTIGAGFDLTVATKLKKEAKVRSVSPSSASPMKKRRKRHRRSISDPEVVRRQIFQAARDSALHGSESEPKLNVEEEVEMDVDVKEPANDDEDVMGLNFMDLNMLDDVHVLPDFFDPPKEVQPLTSAASEYSMASSNASISEQPRTKSTNRQSRRNASGSSGTFKKSNRSRNYACSKCGQPKKGHICPLAPAAPPKMVSMATQVDLNVTHCERVLVTRPFRSYSLC